MKQNDSQGRKTVVLSMLAITLSAVALVTGVYLTATAFTANSFLKAVAASNEAENLFASNILAGHTTEPTADKLDASRKSLTFSDKGEWASFTVEVYNFQQSNRSVYNTKDVTYDLSIEASGVDSWKVGADSVAGAKYTVNGKTLSGTGPQSHSYTISFPKSDVGKANFVIKAVAQQPTGTNLWGLARKVVTGAESTVKTNDVSGYVQTPSGTAADETASVKDLDAYNYVITVTGQDADVTLVWNKDNVELEPYFGENNNVTPGNGSVTFHMEPGSKAVTFYRKGDTVPSTVKDLGISVE